MSRQIDLTKPLSDDDRLYLESRGMQRELDENALHLMGGGASEDAPEEASTPEKVEETKEETKDESAGDTSAEAVVDPEVTTTTGDDASTGEVTATEATEATGDTVTTEATTAEETATPEVEPYKGVTVVDLKTEIERRNSQREEAAKITVAAPGNRPELLAALVEDDKTAV